MVWQMLENRLIHPYVLAGVTVDADRQWALVAEQYRYLSDGRPPARGCGSCRNTPKDR